VCQSGVMARKLGALSQKVTLTGKGGDSGLGGCPVLHRGHCPLKWTLGAAWARDPPGAWGRVVPLAYVRERARLGAAVRRARHSRDRGVPGQAPQAAGPGGREPPSPIFLFSATLAA
jgi:hypothetical protein